MSLPSTSPDFTDPAARLKHMRQQLRPYWTPIESGGVFLLAGVDETKYRQFLEDFYLLAEAPSNEARNIVLSDLLSRDARRFFELAELAPGTYELENYHLNYAQDGKLAFSAYDDEDSEPFTLPAEHSFVFELTAEHLKLLRHMNTRDWSGYIEAMDPKRPYGDMTYYYIDMADALGEGPLARNADGYADEALEKRYDKLHQEMLFAIQAFWQYAEGGIDEKVSHVEKRVHEFRSCVQHGDLAGAEALYSTNPDLWLDFLSVFGGADPANQTSRNAILDFAEHILEADESSLWLQAGRAALYADQNELFARVCERLGFRVAYFSNFAAQLLEQKDYRRALQLLRVITSKRTASPTDWNNLAYALIPLVELERPADLNQLMEETAQHAPANPHIWHNMACVWAKTGDMDRAIEAVACARRDGYEKMDAIAGDDDLAVLHGDSRFRAALEGPISPSTPRSGLT